MSCALFSSFLASQTFKITQEALPEPTAAELAKEAEQEASVFAQAVNVENLLYMLRNLDPSKDSLVDNEEIQVCGKVHYHLASKG